MSVHFDFVVSDIDAETIMDAMNADIVKTMVDYAHAMADGSGPATLEWYWARVEYLRLLKAKMKNCSVKESGE